MAGFLSVRQAEASWSAPRDQALKPYSPEPDSLRGRKRHRSLTRCEVQGANLGETGDSSTLRGRTRRRSTSLVNATSRAASASRGHTENSMSPARKRLLRVVALERRRSQSPSRSRSPNGLQISLRRRQRTRSRSRNHVDEAAYRPEDQYARLRQDVLRRQANKPAVKEEAG